MAVPVYVARMHRRTLGLSLVLVSLLGCLEARSEAPPASETRRLIALLDVEPGDPVAEIGAGNGELAVAIAELLGSRSRIYATELRGELTELRNAVTGSGNVTVVEALPDETNLPEGCCEAVFMRRVFHHFRKPERNASSLFRTVRPGGRVAVIDFEPKAHWNAPEGTPDRGGHGMPSDELVKQMTAAGFELVQIDREWSGDLYAAVFRRP